MKKKENVTAVIELKITPAKDTGFAKIAQKIAKFPQVEACFLMSGAYDLLVFVNGASLQEVALFVSGQLSTIEGVLSTATHFMLKTYKAKGLLADFAPDRRLSPRTWRSCPKAASARSSTSSPSGRTSFLSASANRTSTRPGTSPARR